jgi:dTDP-4-amino-4,6-dideoxygalactose transaminase
MSDTKIPLSVPCLAGNAARYVQECIDTNFVSSVGPFVGRFEAEFAGHVGTAHAVACSCGTAALHVALRVAGVGTGDEVLVSDFTFIATVNPVAYLGARPVLVDANRTTWNMDPDLVIEELDRRARSGEKMPRAVLAAHVLGLPADLLPIRVACAQHGIVLIEDAAEALGAEYEGGPLGGRHVGTIGLLGCFSFNGNKIITCGGGGMIVTPDAVLARRARHLTTQARLPGPEYFHDEIGYNYRLTNLAAALGVAQLEHLDAFIARKQAIARRYDEALGGLPGITLPPRATWARPSMWLYSILVDPAAAGIARTVLQERLGRHGIETRFVWAPAHLMPCYRDVSRLGGAVGEMLFAQGLSLPCSISLTDSDQLRIIEALYQAMNQTDGVC